MIRVCSFLSILLLGVVSVVNANGSSSADDRSALWKLVEKAQSEGLPKTAVKQLQRIYESAVADKEFVEATRAYCAIARTEGEINQPMQPYIIRKLQADVPDLPAEMKPVMQVIQAEWFLQYYFQNRWRFAQRSQTGQSPSEDFETWDLPRLLGEIDRLLTEALANADSLKNVPVADYEPLIIKGTVTDAHRPTLFDFLAYRAIDFYSLDEQIVRSEDAFDLKADSPVFGSVDEFLAWKPATSDQKSGLLKSIGLYQELLRFHASDKDPTARLDADLHRLRFADQKTSGNESTARFRAGLQRFADQHVKHELSSLALALLAGSHQGANDLVEARKIALVGMERFPESVGGKQCFNIVQQIEATSVSVVTEQIWNAAKPEFQVTYKNLDRLHFRLVPFDFRRWQWGRHQRPENMDPKDREKLAKRKPLKEWSVGLLATPDFKTRTNSIDAPLGLPSGCYLLLSSLKDDFGDKDNMMSVTHVWISELQVITRKGTDSKNTLTGQVVNAISGDPIQEANVLISRWQQDGNNSREVSVGTVQTDGKGFYRQELSEDGRRYQYQIYVQHADQKFGLTDNSGYFNRRSNTYQSTLFFTDRSIYRPGQSIQFKGICISVNQEENDYQSLANRKLTVGLFDPNGQQIEQRDFETNQYGSIAGSFEAPADRGTGRMSLRVIGGPSGQTNIRVEEYKRPKFFVDVEKPTEQVRLNQDVTVKVKATGYTGAAVDGAKVTWRVVRNVRYPQWWYWRSWYAPPSSSSQQMANDLGETDSDGTFEVTFPAKADPSVDRESQPVFVFTVYADVTDSAGETRSSSQTIAVGYTALEARLSCNDWQTTDQPVELKLNTTTLDGSGQTAKGKLTIYHLEGPETPQRAKLGGIARNADTTDLSDIKSWPLGESVKQLEIETDEKGSAKTEAQLPAGPYKAVFETTDAAGQAVSAEIPFQVFDLEADKFTTRVANVFEAEAWTVEPGNDFVGLWGTGYETGRAYVEIEHRGKIVDQYWTNADRTQVPIRFSVTEEHRGGFQVRVTFVRDNRVYVVAKRIDVPWSNKNLTIKWEHFVSKLTPGGRETWTAVISGPDAEKAVAEMVAGMYDASLDAFAPHRWSNSIQNLFYRDYARTSVRTHNQTHRLNNFAYSYSIASKPIALTYREFSHDVVPHNHWRNNKLSFYGRGSGGFGGNTVGRGLKSQRMRMESRVVGGMRQNVAVPYTENVAMSFAAPMAAGQAVMMDKSSVVNESLSVSGEEGRESEGSGTGVDVKLDQVTARTNLQETAFFFPQLMTDENGTVRIEFEIPEALTKWKFLGLAHDAQLRTAMLTDEMTTSKDLMVQANPPRFLREGDKIEFSVKITNLSDVDQAGKVQLTLADASTDENLDSRFANVNTEQTFSVPAGQSKSVFWKLAVPDYVGVIAWKAVGATENLSDGEEGLLPVLSKRILVSESLPLPIRGKQTKTFTFNRLNMIDSSDSLKTQSLTVQMTSNPAWYAVMALPYLMEYPHQCNEQVFNRLYANALGRHIVTSQPNIERIFGQWRGTDALDSPLEKNEDIRNVLIAETPWLRAGKKESQRRRDVAILFEQNRLENELRRAAKQLAESQYSDGSWSWFPGGPANDFITLYITTGFGRLRHLGVEVDARPAIKSLSRLDGWINSTYQLLRQKDNLDRNNLTSTICLYLYGRSFFLKDQGIADQYRPAVDYFLGQAKEHWLSMSKMSQGHLAIATKRFGDAETPSKIMASLTERSQNDEELGRFWTENEDGWWWYRAPIETQALIIEAYDEVSSDAAKVEDCKVWLLKQKQTQNWKTTKATADAVYALLLRGTDALASDKLVEVSLGGTKIEPQDVEAGTGFYEQKFAGSEVTSNMKTVEVKKSDDGVAWGSVHWQYLEDVSKIEPYEGTPLQLKKALFIKKNTPDGQTITPIDGPVEVGDEVVTRVELRVDRDMEYVHLKDQRGSGTEPVNVLSRYKHQDGLWYYESTRDTASHFFIDYLRRGTYVFEYSVRVQHRGQYQSGIASLQCMYAPEFNSHSNSVAIEVK